MALQPIVEAKDLRFSFQSAVIAGISFQIEQGEFVSFIGPSGCGKTTLLQIIAGIRTSEAGDLAVRTDRISFAFQQDSLLPWRSALGNVLLPFELKGIAVTDALRERAAGLLGALGLSGYESFAPAELSGGMKKRVELARALVTEPDLLIMDEPFSSLDIITRERLNILVRGIRAMRRCAVILVTHSVEEACFLSEKIYVLSSRPARIIDLKLLDKNGSPGDQYLLSAQEMETDREIRRDAKALWATAAAENGTPGAAGPPPFDHFVRRHYAKLLIPLELLLIFFVAAFLKVHIPIPDYILPSPAGVLARFVSTLANGTILPDLTATVTESLAGFAIAFGATLLLGYGIAKSRVASSLLMPYLVAANTIPSVALAPFLVLWFGFGMTPRIITSVIVIFFPMLISTISAIDLASRRTAELAAFFRPTRFRRFLHFELPASLPLIANGVKVSITLSVIGAVVGEFVSGRRGLGALVGIAKANFDIELMFVALTWLILLGLAYYGLAHLFTRVVSRRIS